MKSVTYAYSPRDVAAGDLPEHEGGQLAPTVASVSGHEHRERAGSGSGLGRAFGSQLDSIAAVALGSVEGRVRALHQVLQGLAASCDSHAD